MKRRYLYLLLFSVPIVLASAVVAFAVFGAAAGILWLLLAGDTPWPPAADTLLGGVFVLAFAASALAFTSWAYAVGRQEETATSLNVRHAVAAVGATVLYAAGLTFVLVKVLDRTMGLRVHDEDEAMGLDNTQHRESAYTLMD